MISVQHRGTILTIGWSVATENVIIEVIDEAGVVLARTVGTPEMHYERSPNNDVIHIIVRASDGNVLAKRSY